MKTTKKAAFLIYPMFCNWEIALTLATLEMYGKEIVVFAKDKNPVKCEEGMKIIADKSLDEFVIDEYDLILLSGIGGHPDPVIYDNIYVDFLKQFVDREDIIIAAISLAPVLLAQAGLLKQRLFCIGMYEEDRKEFSFFDYENKQPAPVVVDGNIITAMGMAFREFAIAVAERLGFKCREGLWSEIKYPINPDDYIFRIKYEISALQNDHFDIFKEMVGICFNQDYKIALSEKQLDELCAKCYKQAAEKIIYVDLLFLDGNANGFIIYQIDSPESDWCEKVTWGCIRELYITAHVRDKGFGKIMVGHAENKLGKLATPKIYVTSDDAIGFWLKMGYHDTGEICAKNEGNILVK